MPSKSQLNNAIAATSLGFGVAGLLAPRALAAAYGVSNPTVAQRPARGNGTGGQGRRGP